MKARYLVPTVLLTSMMLQASEVAEITKGVPFVKIEADGKTYKIEREQKADSYLTNTFALTSRPSPPFYIEPFSVSDNVETFGELEVLDFLEKKKGLFIDARLENWYLKSAIPGAVNIPFKLFLTDTPERDKILTDLGGVKKGAGIWDFSNWSENNARLRYWRRSSAQYGCLPVFHNGAGQCHNDRQGFLQLQ